VILKNKKEEGSKALLTFDNPPQKGKFCLENYSILFFGPLKDLKNQ
jgi:hypothetical protein